MTRETLPFQRLLWLFLLNPVVLSTALLVDAKPTFGSSFLNSLRKRANIMTIQSTSSDHGEKPFFISIWLLPSQDQHEKLSKAIEGFSQNPAASVPFQPHVTVVGGIPCPSRDHLETTLLPSLKERVQKANSCLTCQFATTPVYKNKWNQACVMVLEESNEFSQLVRNCREVAMDDPGTPQTWYPPPLKKPHMSLYYGESDAPTPEEETEGLGISSGSSAFWFEADRIAIWRTQPASTEGVAQWEELAVIDLPQRNNKSSL